MSMRAIYNGMQKVGAVTDDATGQHRAVDIDGKAIGLFTTAKAATIAVLAEHELRKRAAKGELLRDTATAIHYSTTRGRA